MIAAVIVMLLTSSASAQVGLAGTWKAVFTGPVAEQPKTFAEAFLNLTVTGTAITGTVEMGNWPGLCQISDSKVEGKEFSFFATGTLWSTSGYPRVKFAGTFEDGAIKDLTMTWGYVGQAATGRTLRMDATRLPR